MIKFATPPKRKAKGTSIGGVKNAMNPKNAQVSE